MCKNLPPVSIEVPMKAGSIRGYFYYMLVITKFNKYA